MVLSRENSGEWEPLLYVSFVLGCRRVFPILIFFIEFLCQNVRNSRDSCRG